MCKFDFKRLCGLHVQQIHQFPLVSRSRMSGSGEGNVMKCNTNKHSVQKLLMRLFVPDKRNLTCCETTHQFPFQRTSIPACVFTCVQSPTSPPSPQLPASSMTPSPTLSSFLRPLPLPSFPSHPMRPFRDPFTSSSDDTNENVVSKIPHLSP